MSVGLREGGVLFMSGRAAPLKDGKPHELKSRRIVFSDDFKSFEIDTSNVSLPNAVMHTRWAKFWPVFDKGKIVLLPNGDLMATLYGDFKGDTQYRTMIVRSTDSGKSWQFHATVAYDPDDPDPQLMGGYCGFCESSLALLRDGRFLCMMRTQGTELSAEYRPMYVSWSDSQGKTWTKPVPTKPHLLNISPTLAVLDNGVVACQYGRPGFHVSFSPDNGHTWRDRISFSNLHEPLITGQYDMVKVAPNRLVAVGSDAGGTKVWPIDVERVKAGPARTELTGRVLDQAGLPIVGAKVQLGPNRYTADAWMESEQFDRYKLQRMPLHPPLLGYRSIAKKKSHPLTKTDTNGRFEFKGVKLVEYVLTVEANGYAPQWRHIKVGPQPQTNKQQFQLQAGRSIRGRVVDESGKPVAAACVVLDRWHIHADADGFFHWAIDAPLPKEVTVKVYKRYDGNYGTFQQKLSPSQIAKRPIVLPSTK